MEGRSCTVHGQLPFPGAACAIPLTSVVSKPAVAFVESFTVTA